MTIMNKSLIVHGINGVDKIPEMERWFARYHCPEVLAQEPWLTRYLMFRVMPPASGMEKLGFLNYRVHENWNQDIERRRGLKGLMAMTPEPVEDAMTVAVANIPAEPTEDFFGRDLKHTDSAFIRFVTLTSYPKGVSKEEGEDWFLNTHAPEVCKLPGLMRFFSHKCYDKAYSPLPADDDVPDFAEFDGLFYHKWDRVNEMWFANNSAWTKAFVENKEMLTKPKWATRDEYPFVEPLKDFVCTSLLERPDQNMMKHYEGFVF